MRSILNLWDQVRDIEIEHVCKMVLTLPTVCEGVVWTKAVPAGTCITKAMNRPLAAL